MMQGCLSLCPSDLEDGTIVRHDVVQHCTDVDHRLLDIRKRMRHVCTNEEAMQVRENVVEVGIQARYFLRALDRRDRERVLGKEPQVRRQARYVQVHDADKAFVSCERAISRNVDERAAETNTHLQSQVDTNRQKASAASCAGLGATDDQPARRANDRRHRGS